MKFPPLIRTPICRLERNLHERVCRQMQTNELLESLCIYKIHNFDISVVADDICRPNLYSCNQ